MRALLDRLYWLSGVLAAVFLALIGVETVGQILGRFVAIPFDATEITGFSMAASTFLGLAYTFRSGSHIRVNLLVRTIQGPVRRVIELWCIGITLVVLAALTYQAVLLAHGSFVFGDLSPGLMAVPFWIPQSGMALGVAILTIALADEFVCVLLRGGTPTYLQTESDDQAPHA